MEKKIEIVTPEEMERILKESQGESPASPAGEAPSDQDLAPLEDSAASTDVEALQQKAALADEYLDALQRKQAEFENYRKRILRDQEETRLRAAQELILELLDVADAFRRAIDTARSQEEITLQSYVEGVDLVEKKFWDTLSKRGVEHIAALGADFDPHLHDAVMQQESADHRDGEVIGVVKEGYLLGGKVLRPASVIVARNPGE